MDDTLLVLRILDSLAGFAWPAVAVAFLVVFRRHFVALIQRDDVELAVGDLKVSAKRAAFNAAEQLVNLQERIAALEVAQAKAGVPVPEAPYAADAPPPAPDVPGDSSPGPAKTARRSVLWVDDIPENNAFIVAKLSDEGYAIDLAGSTEEGLRAFQSRGHDMVITDMLRIEKGRSNRNAGRDLIRGLRELDATVPILVFAGRRTVASRGELVREGATEVTDSVVDIFKFLANPTRGA